MQDAEVEVKSAANFLKQQGIDVINGGPWQNVNQLMV